MKIFTNVLLVGKIMASAPAAIPFRICVSDRGANTITEKIDCALKSAARVIARTRLKDKVPSDLVLQRAGLRGLNEMVASTSAMLVWKSKKCMNPLGKLLFPEKPDIPLKMSTRSDHECKAKLPVPGHGTLAGNLLARAWNDATELQNASTIGTAKSASKSWARSLNFRH